MSSKLLLTYLAFSITSSICRAQFHPAATVSGTNAIYKDSSVLVAWASDCHIIRGYQNIANTALGYASVGNSSSALGKAGENGIVSLGDGGQAIVTFNKPIFNGPGYDFAVFENGFNNSFLELAFVEVSSDGENFFRFKSTFLDDTTKQFGNDASMDASKINNLAGKYQLNYGTPFDLEELSEIKELDLNHITHVKIIDVVGSIADNYAQYDFYGNKINDPYPTPYASGGFDLDAVGVINELHQVGLFSEHTDQEFVFLPNPCSRGTAISLGLNERLVVYNLLGNKMEVMDGSTSSLVIDQRYEPGIYLFQIISKHGVYSKKIWIE